MHNMKFLIGVVTAAALVAACGESSPTAPIGRQAGAASFGRNPGAGGNNGGGAPGGGGGGGGVKNCGQPLVTLAHGAQFGLATQGGVPMYRPLNAAAFAVAPHGLDFNCNIIP